MASISAVSMAPPPAKMGPKHTRSVKAGSSTHEKAAKEKKKAGVGLTAAATAMAAAIVVPEIAEAAQPGVSPSLENFLLSIASGGVVVGVIVGAVVRVSNPVKQN